MHISEQKILYRFIRSLLPAADGIDVNMPPAITIYPQAIYRSA